MSLKKNLNFLSWFYFYLVYLPWPCRNICLRILLVFAVDTVFGSKYPFPCPWISQPATEHFTLPPPRPIRTPPPSDEGFITWRPQAALAPHKILRPSLGSVQHEASHVHGAAHGQRWSSCSWQPLSYSLFEFVLCTVKDLYSLSKKTR